MDYYSRLALALRSRGASRGEVADLVRELRGLELSDELLEKEFGSPEDYANGLELAGRERTSRVLIYSGLALAVAWFVLVALGRANGWDVIESMGPIATLPAVGLILLGVLGQFVRDWVASSRIAHGRAAGGTRTSED